MKVASGNHLGTVFTVTKRAGLPRTKGFRTPSKKAMSLLMQIRSICNDSFGPTLLSFKTSFPSGLEVPRVISLGYHGQAGWLVIRNNLNISGRSATVISQCKDLRIYNDELRLLRIYRESLT